MVPSGGRWQPVAASSAVTDDGSLDVLGDDGGPSHESAARCKTIHVNDLSVENRWPLFVSEALQETAVRSLLCLPLHNDHHTWGTLTLHAEAPCMLDAGTERSGAILATHAALTRRAVHQTRHLRWALGSRDIIGQAKGILLER